MEEVKAFISNWPGLYNRFPKSWFSIESSSMPGALGEALVPTLTTHRTTHLSAGKGWRVPGAQLYADACWIDGPCFGWCRDQRSVGEEEWKMTGSVGCADWFWSIMLLDQRGTCWSGWCVGSITQAEDHFLVWGLANSGGACSTTCTWKVCWNEVVEGNHIWHARLQALAPGHSQVLT